MTARAAAVVLVAAAGAYLVLRLTDRQASGAAVFDQSAWYMTGDPQGGIDPYDPDMIAELDNPSTTAESGEGAGFLGEYAAYVLPIAHRAQSFFNQYSGGLYMRTSIAGINEIRRHEALRLEPYKDIAGHWTVGYGHKLLPHESIERITEQRAVELLTSDVGTAEDAVNARVKVPVNQAQFDALVSLAYNIGVGAFGNSTLLRKLNAGDYAGAQQQFLVWNKARIGGTLQVSRGLMNRRMAEAEMFGSAYA